MGEKIKKLAFGKIFNNNLEIELNHSHTSGKDQLVHIQSKSFRLEMDEKEFIKYALSLLVAEKNLRKLKGIE